MKFQRQAIASIAIALLSAGCATVAPPVAGPSSRPTTVPVEERGGDGAPPAEPRSISPRTAPESATGDTRASSSPAVIALLNDAGARERDGDYDHAIAVLERAVRIEPRNAQVWHRLARLNLHHGDPSQAESMARKSIQFAGGDARLQAANWRLIAAARRQRGDVKGADAADAQAAILDARSR